MLGFPHKEGGGSLEPGRGGQEAVCRCDPDNRKNGNPLGPLYRSRKPPTLQIRPPGVCDRISWWNGPADWLCFSVDPCFWAEKADNWVCFAYLAHQFAAIRGLWIPRRSAGSNLSTRAVGQGSVLQWPCLNLPRLTICPYFSQDAANTTSECRNPRRDKHSRAGSRDSGRRVGKRTCWSLGSSGIRICLGFQA